MNIACNNYHECVHNIIGVIAFNMKNQVDFKVESESTLQFILDDLGCNGTENNLLECLPEHNCMQSPPEDAGVRCLRKGTVIMIQLLSSWYSQLRLSKFIERFYFKVSGWNLVPTSFLITL